MEPAVRVVKRFQTVALAATAVAVGYTLLHEPASSGTELQHQASGQQRSRQAHTLTGETIDPEKQSALARALDTDCETCLETRRKLFGMFGAAKAKGGSPGDAGGSSAEQPR